MPRYFFHQRIGAKVMWDRVGHDLPDLQMTPDADETAALWRDILAGRLEPNRILVVTDEIGQVLFVSPR